MTGAPLRIAVVGHTNTGKTSLMRTLTRDEAFGEVSDRPATTRHIEGASLMVRGRAAIELYDTPGLEDSIALLDLFDSLREGRRADDVEAVRRFLESEPARGRFAQEAKAIRQVLASDAALYVIDVRDRVLGKHRDELEIFRRCARPIVPVLNFTTSPEAQTALWREHLSRAGLHAVAEFDTVVLDEHSEQRLLEKMRTLLDAHRSTLDALIAERREQRARLARASAETVADLLIDVAACVAVVPVAGRADADAATEAMRARIRHREQRCVERLLELHRFCAADYKPDDLPLVDGRWGVDLFSPAAMKQAGVRTTGAAAAGAMIGLTVDAMVGGMSLGAATALGAALGAALGLGRTHGKRLIDQARGRSELRCDPATLRVLLARQTSLALALFRRGHASMQPIMTVSPGTRLPDGTADRVARTATDQALALLDHAKLHPDWSDLNAAASPPALTGQSRQSMLERLTGEVEALMGRSA